MAEPVQKLKKKLSDLGCRSVLKMIFFDNFVHGIRVCMLYVYVIEECMLDACVRVCYAFTVYICVYERVCYA